jgi:hypothetical protein
MIFEVVPVAPVITGSTRVFNSTYIIIIIIIITTFPDGQSGPARENTMPKRRAELLSL